MHSTGYAIVSFFGQKHSLHKILYFLHHPHDDYSLICDHINGDPLDNRMWNLRLASKKQNGANSKIPKTNRTGFKGVHFPSRRGGKYTAHIGEPSAYLGSFSTALDAARAYNKAARKKYGRFARLNSLQGK